MLEKTLGSPLDSKEIQPVNPTGNQPWILIGRTNAEAPILWPPDVKSQLIGKDPDAGEDWGQEEKGATEDEMVGWRHWFDGHEIEQALGDGDGQGSLACCSPWGCKKSDMTEQINNNNFYYYQVIIVLILFTNHSYECPYGSKIVSILVLWSVYFAFLISSQKQRICHHHNRDAIVLGGWLTSEYYRYFFCARGYVPQR